jgi:hypothetical protein
VPGGWPDGAPPRAAFFGLTPAGHDGESFESLSSYFRRLSGRHGILPRSLAYRTVVPLFSIATRHNHKALSASCYGLGMDGLSRLSAEWVGALERLMLRADLHLRTLLPLRNCVPTFALISQRERCCPRCYEEDLQLGRQIYNRLLWSVGCVDACPRHGILLQVVPAPKRKLKPPFWLPGSGYDLGEIPRHPATEQQVQSARLVAQLLDDVHRFPTLLLKCRSAGTFLQHAVDTLFDGKSAHFAKHLGICKSELHGWMNSKNRPTLARLTLIAFCCGCDISDVLRGNKVRLRKVNRTSPTTRLTKKTRAGAARPTEELQEDLKKLVDANMQITLRAAARLLDVSERYLRRIAPEVTKLLVAKGREARHTKSVRTSEQRFEYFQQAFQQLTRNNEYPALYKLRVLVYDKTGIKLGYKESHNFFLRIRQLNRRVA